MGDIAGGKLAGRTGGTMARLGRSSFLPKLAELLSPPARQFNVFGVVCEIVAKNVSNFADYCDCAGQIDFGTFIQ